MEDVLYEHQFVAELQRLIAKAGDKQVHLCHTFPGGLLVVTGYRPEITGRTLSIALQRETTTGVYNGVLQIVLPEEEVAQYRGFEDENGELYLSVAYPYCRHNILEDAEIARVEIATAEVLIDPAVNSSTLQ